MKNKFILMVIASALLLMISCNEAVNIDQVLTDENTRNQVFNKIATDHEMMTGFMEVMMKDNHAMMMMKGNPGMKDMMMGESGMMQMMKDKPDVMHNMMGEMMKDGKMMGHMMKMMKDQGMMSEECMESCMKTMDDKGMSMGEMMNGDKEDDHDSHNH